MEKNKKDLMVQAAKASWIIPLLNLLIMAIGNSITKQGIQTHIPILVIIISLLFLSGFIFGIIGLFGVKKYGFKTILLPSLIGIILNVSFVYILIIVGLNSFNQAVSNR